MSDSVLQRRIALGIYPQRDDAKPGWLERAGRQLLEYPLALLSGQRLRERPDLAAIERHAARLQDLTAEELGEVAIDLRLQLRRRGLARDPVARSFALVRETARRVLGQAHYDTQLRGGWAMLYGRIVEMETGEGKTLMATLPACTAALAGIPVHVVTVNDYLASRDAQWMRPVYEALGLSVAAIATGMDSDARRAAYASDIAYCTNKQAAFDYLRDRLILKRYGGEFSLQVADIGANHRLRDNLFLRGLCFAIVDEADSVLIDEAVTPLIISRPGDTGHKLEVFARALELARELREGPDFEVDPRERRIYLTGAGAAQLRRRASDLEGLWRNSRYREDLVTQALRAEVLFHRDQQYLVRDGRVEIVDEFTGRVMADRSWDRGLQQMIEVKEGCEITGEQETLGRISYQRFFRRYLKLGGMTGTARELRRELLSVYRLRIKPVRPYRRVRRRRYGFTLLRDQHDKFRRVLQRVEQMQAQGRPVLIGTRSVAASEELGQMLQDAGIDHRVLNARQDADEAEIIAAAGQRGQVTVATNMAGRGTDIRLDKDVIALGGLHVIATEHHESARIDRQLFGRCGRQGDPGSFEAITALDDELLLRYAPPRLLALVDLLWKRAPWLARMPARWLTRSAQRAAEKKNAIARARVLRSEDYLENVLAFTGFQE